MVSGATPEEMQRLGYRPVGRDFPVFLHPETAEEYALARLERKVAPGYRGFVTEFSPQVTLEQDLERRDLTINAMAQRADGSIIDPYGGRADLERRLLRHVSPAFTEDPVRILRVALHGASRRWIHRGAGDRRPDAGDGAAGRPRLVPERVWRELERALAEPQPRAFRTLSSRRARGIAELAAACAPRPAADWRRCAGAHGRSRSGSTPVARLAALAGGLAESDRISAAEAPGDYRELLRLVARLRSAAGRQPPPRQRLRDLTGCWRAEAADVPPA
jgi:hypothetical protein